VTYRVVALSLVTAAMLAGCAGGPGAVLVPGSGGGSGGGSGLGNLLRFGSTELPPALEPVEDEVECPPVSILPGGAALRIGGGESESVRSQVTITDVARECARGPGGSVIMKVGAEGRVLVGPAGGAGSLGAPMRIEVRRNDQVLSSRVVRVGATVPSGQGQAGWVHVEQGINVPASAFASGDVDVFLSLGGSAAPARRRR
jgi:hypothetical protein